MKITKTIANKSVSNSITPVGITRTPSYVLEFIANLIGSDSNTIIVYETDTNNIKWSVSVPGIVRTLPMAKRKL